MVIKLIVTNMFRSFVRDNDMYLMSNAINKVNEICLIELKKSILRARGNKRIKVHPIDIYSGELKEVEYFLIKKSVIKQIIKDNNLNVYFKVDYFDYLNYKMILLIKKAIKRAKDNRRKSLSAKDF